MGKWRQKAKKIIGAALAEAENQGVKSRELRRYLAPFYNQYAKSVEGSDPRREKYPYRVWCEEVNRILEAKKTGVQQISLDLGVT